MMNSENTVLTEGNKTTRKSESRCMVCRMGKFTDTKSRLWVVRGWEGEGVNA